MTSKKQELDKSMKKLSDMDQDDFDLVLDMAEDICNGDNFPRCIGCVTMIFSRIDQIVHIAEKMATDLGDYHFDDNEDKGILFSLDWDKERSQWHLTFSYENDHIKFPFKPVTLVEDLTVSRLMTNAILSGCLGVTAYRHGWKYVDQTPEPEAPLPETKEQWEFTLVNNLDEDGTCWVGRSPDIDNKGLAYAESITIAKQLMSAEIDCRAHLTEKQAASIFEEFDVEVYR